MLNIFAQVGAAVEASQYSQSAFLVLSATVALVAIALWWLFRNKSN
jgi:hypothetical protein